MDFSQLASTAQELNQKSNAINTIIRQVNETLTTLNIGLEVWIDDPVHASPFHKVNEDHPTLPDARSRVITHVGYTEVEGRWQLTIKQATELWTGRGDKEEWVDDEDTVISPLEKAPRAIRVASLPLLNEIIIRLEQAAEAAIIAIDEAQESVAQTVAKAN